ANHALVLHAAILAAGAFPVLFRTKDALAEQTIALGAIGTIVDRFGLFHFAERPASNIVRPRQADFHSRIVVNAIVGRFADAHVKNSLTGAPRSESARCLMFIVS